MYQLEYYILNAVIAYLLVGYVASYIGHLIEIRGATFLTAQVAHSVLAGAALGVYIDYLFGVDIDPLVTAIAVGILSGLLAGYIGRYSGLERGIGAVLAFTMGIAVILMGIIPPEGIPVVWSYLMGDILLLDEFELILLSISALIASILGVLFYRELLYVAFDEEGAEMLGLNTTLYYYLGIFLSSLAIIIVSKALGSIVVYAVFIIPPMIARIYKATPIASRAYIFLLILSTGYLSLASSLYLNIPPSGLQAVLLVLTLLISILYRSLRSRL